MLHFGDSITVEFSNLLLFLLSVIGFTHIIVDPATIMKPFRNFVTKYGSEWINKLFSCYQCCGTWVGFFCGFLFKAGVLTFKILGFRAPFLHN